MLSAHRFEDKFFRQAENVFRYFASSFSSTLRFFICSFDIVGYLYSRIILALWSRREIPGECIEGSSGAGLFSRYPQKKIWSYFPGLSGIVAYLITTERRDMLNESLTLSMASSTTSKIKQYLLGIWTVNMLTIRLFRTLPKTFTTFQLSYLVFIAITHSPSLASLA